MKTSLTEAETQAMESYRQRRFERALAPVDKPRAESLLREIMSDYNLETGIILWAASPKVAQVIIASLHGVEDKNPKHKATDATLRLAAASLAAHGEPLVSFGYNDIAAPWIVGDGWVNGWISFYSFAASLVTNVPEELLVKLRRYEGMSDCVSAVYSYRGVSIMTERPISRWTSTKIADKPVLHCADGPSVEFPDYKLYHWRGTAVPEAWIMSPASVAAEDALTWPNTEQRLALCEILGWDKVLSALNPVVIDKDPDPMLGTLLECDLPGSGRTLFLRALCGTGRTITLLVDPDAKTAAAAGAASYGVPVELYRRMKIRT